MLALRKTEKARNDGNGNAYRTSLTPRVMTFRVCNHISCLLSLMESLCLASIGNYPQLRTTPYAILCHIDAIRSPFKTALTTSGLYKSSINRRAPLSSAARGSRSVKHFEEHQKARNFQNEAHKTNVKSSPRCQACQVFLLDDFRFLFKGAVNFKFYEQ